MPASSSIKILNTMEWAKQLNFGRSSGLGNSLEPSLTSANTILQTIIGPPFSWRWNRSVIGFITISGQQDYTLFNYTASTATKAGWLTVDDAGNSQLCVTAGTTGSGAPSWNHTSNGMTTDGTAVWRNLGSLNNTEAVGSYTFGWIETSSVQDSSSKWFEMSSKLCLGLESSTSRPQYISAQGDDGLGNITIRLMPTPDAAYPVVITVQQKPPVLTSLNQTWSPIPNEFSRIYNWGFLSMMWLFADDPRFGMANQKFISALLQSSEGLTETERNIFLNNWQAITGQPISSNDKMQQGWQARGM